MMDDSCSISLMHAQGSIGGKGRRKKGMGSGLRWGLTSFTYCIKFYLRITLLYTSFGGAARTSASSIQNRTDL